MGEPSELLIDQKSGCTWITLPDAINMDTYGAIEKSIGERAAGYGGCVVVDLGKTSNLFSSGLGLIIRVRKLVMESKGRIFLVNVSGKIREILETVQLDKVFTMYATDVEFEISQDEIFKQRCTGNKVDFVFVNHLENNVNRIHISGQMTVEQNLSSITNYSPDTTVTQHVFDLTGLDLIDSTGASMLIKLLMNIHRQTGKCIAYGVNDSIAGLVDILGLNEYLHFFSDERTALESIGKAN